MRFKRKNKSNNYVTLFCFKKHIEKIWGVFITI